MTFQNANVHRVSSIQEEQGGIFRIFRRKWKFALFKESIDDALKQLTDWHSIADPTWFLIIRMNKPNVDRALVGSRQRANAMQIRDATRRSSQEEGRGVFLPPAELERMTIYEIPLSTAKMAQRMTPQGPQNLILTALETPVGARADLVAREVRELAYKLAVNDPGTFGLFSCKGVVRELLPNPFGPSPTRFTMVFRSPDNESDVESLRSSFSSRDDLFTLETRFLFARQLAKSVAYIHNFGFVHKCIRPENVLILKGDRQPMPTAYLAGYNNFRKEDGRTYRQGEHEWEKNLYIHPSRQGPNPREDYVMQHDIYSLGVCLLEIGFWESFIAYDRDGAFPQTTALLDPFVRDCQAGVSRLQDVKAYFVQLCRTRLPRHVGRKYCEVVETCLTCLDPENVDFGDEGEFKDSDGILVGVRYIEKVCRVVFSSRHHIDAQ